MGGCAGGHGVVGGGAGAQASAAGGARPPAGWGTGAAPGAAATHFCAALHQQEPGIGVIHVHIDDLFTNFPNPFYRAVLNGCVERCIMCMVEIHYYVLSSVCTRCTFTLGVKPDPCLTNFE